MPETENNEQGTLAHRLLTEMRDTRRAVSLYLVNGFQLKGEILEFDGETILFKLKGAHQLVMRSAVATMYPLPGSSQESGDEWWRAYAPEGAEPPGTQQG